MRLKLILTVFSCLPFLYDAITLPVIDAQRKKPLPEEVADVYTPERWKSFVSYKRDVRKPYLLRRCISFLMDAFVIWSDFFVWMETLCQGHVYFMAWFTMTIFTLVTTAVSLPFDWHDTFTIEERYGLNRKSKRGFLHDEAISFIGGYAVSSVLVLIAVYVMEHLPEWTNDFSISLDGSFRLMAWITLCAFLLFVLISLFSWFILRMQYHFHELEEGELKQKILGLIKGCRKKIHRIEVYDESTKSTRKNAFLLRLLWYREFGIADNFLNENSERQLLGVLAHEAGHLKHRKNILNWISYCFIALIVILTACMLPQAGRASLILKRVNAAYGLHTHAWVLYGEILGWVMTPAGFLLSLYHNYVSRREEYEADRNAVKEGYGEDLIATFKELSRDELADVNPDSRIEFLEYDHPGMYHRIQAIRKAEREMGNAEGR